MKHFDRIKRSVRTAKLLADDRAQSGASGEAVGLVVALTVAGLVGAFLLPIAIEEIVNVDTTGWGSGATSLWEIMDLAIVLSAFLFFIGIAIGAANNLE